MLAARTFLPAAACALLLFGTPAQAAETRQIVAAKCAACHGQGGTTEDPTIPRLAGLSATYITSQMKAFAEGRRRNEEMAPLAAELGEDGVQAVATWYANKKPAPGKTGDAQLIASGRQLYEEGNGDPAVQPCAVCHLSDGAGNARFPRLAGQHKAYLARQLSEFKAGRRATDPQMVTIARHLNAQETKALVEYIGGL